MTQPPHNEKAGAGLQPDASSETHMAARLAQHDTDQLTLDFTAPIPAGAYDRVDLADENTESHWRMEAMHHIEFLASTGREFTADNVRQAVGEPDHPNRWGAVFLAARRAGLIEPTGTIVPSTTASRHGAIVRVWRGRQAA